MTPGCFTRLFCACCVYGAEVVRSNIFTDRSVKNRDCPIKEARVVRPRLALFLLPVIAVAVLASQAVARSTHGQSGFAPALRVAAPAVPHKTIGYITIFGDPVQLRFARVFQQAAKDVGWKIG